MSDIRLLEIPKWGLSMEEGTIVEWLIAVGDNFVEGQEICEIESSKIANMLEAPYAGTLRRIIAEPGDTLPVQAPIAIAAPPDVTDAEIATFAAQLSAGKKSDSSSGVRVATAPPTNLVNTGVELTAHAKQSAELTRTPASTVIDVPQALRSDEDDTGVHATPRARSLAAEFRINLNRVEGTGRNGRISVADIRGAVVNQGGALPDAQTYVTHLLPPAVSTADDATVAATPLARRVAQSWGVNLHDCRPSGRNGRILRADVEAVVQQRQRAITEPSQSREPVSPVFPETSHDYTDTKLSGMRKTIAARLQHSMQEAPHYRLSMDLSLDSLLSLRKQINNDNPSAKVSVNDCLVKAAALSLLEVPECNIQFDGETIRTFEEAHVSVAVALESGLITPIVNDAGGKGLIAISNEIRTLVTKAKANTLKTQDIQGGTFTVSNLGMYGISHFDAIINPPQAAILAVGAATPRVVVQNGDQVIATQFTVTLSSDHRVIDGALGARWLAAFRDFVERPARLLS